METKTHWKKLANPDYLGASALNPGDDLVVTIKMVRNESITGADRKKEECIVAYFEGDVKPMIVNATNAKSITKLLGSAYIEDWQGKSIQLYAAKVNAFGEQVEALRVRPKLPQLTKPTLSEERFTKALESLKAKTITKDEISARFNLTSDQSKALQEA
jgi:hypothetical protein